MKKALIIGAAGFIGTYLTQRLQKHMDLICIDNLVNGSLNRFKLVNPNSELIRKDICQLSISELPNLDYVFDLSYINGTHQFYTRGSEILQCAALNVTAAINIAKAKKARLIYFSTPEVFGEVTTIPTPENTPFQIPDITNPRWSYSIGKIYSESLLHNTKISDPDFDFNIVRPNNAYGPYDRYHVIPDLMQLISHENDILEVKGDPKSTRSYCFVNDMIEQIYSVATKAPVGETYNLGNATETSLLELVDNVLLVNGKPKKVTFTEAPRGSPMRRAPCTKKIDKLCYLTKTSLVEGLTKILKANEYDPYENF